MTEQSIGTARIDIVVNAEKAEAQVRSVAAELANTGKAADGAANTMTQASRKQIAALERQIATLGMSREEVIRWRIEQQTSGKVAEELKRKLEAQVNTLRAQAAHFNQYGKSAKEMQLALRGVPAQITDIFTSLQGGANPLTVLLQQGGQLRDMFGGITPAAQALGRSLVGLVNPATVAAAALTGLYLAYEGGASEARGFEQALINTNRAIGVTVGDLQDMAREIGASVGSVHSAAKALAEVAASGRFTGEQIGLVARAALAMEKATGQAVGETIKQFIRLGEEPTQAALKLNESTRFLTLEVYEQIKALEQQGRTLEAGNLAMDAATRAAERMASDTRENLGLLESAWAAVVGKAKEYRDMVLDIGRVTREKLNESLLEVQEEIARRARLASGKGSVSDWIESQLSGFANDTEASLRVREEIILRQIRRMDQATREATRKAAQAQAVEDKAAADAEVARFASNQERLAYEKIRIQGIYAQRIANARKAGDEALVRQLQEAEKKVIAGLEAQYREREKKPRAVSDRDSGAALLSQLRQRTAAMEVELQAGGRLTEAQRARIQLDALEAESKGKLTAENKKLIEAEIARLGKLEEMREAQEKAKKAKEELEKAQQRQRETAQRVIDDLQFENELMGKSALEQAKMIALRQAGVTATSEYGQQIQKLVEQQAKLAEQRALLDDVKFAAEDMFASFIDGSKSASEAFEDFAKDLQRIAAQLLAKKAVEWLFNAFLGAGGGNGMPNGGVGTAGGGNPFGWAYDYSTGGYTGPGGKYEPAGIVHKGEVVWSQDDVRRAGGVAVVEAMRRGLRGYAEGGPVSPQYVPLQPMRTRDDAPKVTVVVENHGGGETRTEETTGPDGERMIRVIVNAAVSEVDKRIGTMGSTGRAIQQRFGLNPAGVSRG